MRWRSNKSYSTQKGVISAFQWYMTSTRSDRRTPAISHRKDVGTSSVATLTQPGLFRNTVVRDLRRVGSFISTHFVFVTAFWILQLIYCQDFKLLWLVQWETCAHDDAKDGAPIDQTERRHDITFFSCWRRILPGEFSSENEWDNENFAFDEWWF
jgi:hypothetical protein